MEGGEMIRPIFQIVAIVTLMSAATPAMARVQPEELRPASDWNVDWQQTSCTLTRTFGTAENPFVLRFERTSPNDGFRLLLIGKRLQSVKFMSAFAVKFGDNEPQSYGDRLQTGKSYGDIPTVFIHSSLRKNDLAQNGRSITSEMERAVHTIAVDTSDHSIRVVTGPLDKPFAALRNCTDDLVKQWGLDPAVQAKLKRSPQPRSNPGKWLTDNDYPSAALRAGKSAIVDFRLTIDERGTPVECGIQQAYSADPQFAVLTCNALMKRARFEPALDQEGRPVSSFFASTIHWRILVR
jgi:hypothetical protein